MRHNIKLFAACIMGAAMLLSSCEERIGGEGNIFFTADVASYKGVGTKAAAIGNPDNDTDTYVPMFTDKYGTAGFTVSAYKGTTARFTNAISFYANQKWSLDQTAKWYSGETLDFYAFAPAGAAFASNQSVNPSTKKMTFDYTVSTPFADQQPDFMAGYYSGLGEDGGAGVRVAPMTFYHPLAAVRFKAGDIAGCEIQEIVINNIVNKGTCTIDASTSPVGVSWTLDPSYSQTLTLGEETATGINALLALFDPMVTPEEGEIIGTDDVTGENEYTGMIIPQTLPDNAELIVALRLPGDPKIRNYTVSLAGTTLEAGKLYTFKIDFKGVTINFDEQPLGMILPWEDLAPIEYNDFDLVPTMAYLCSGSDFNSKLAALAGGAQNITKVVFDRGGTVDESGEHIEDPTHPEGYPIYASYDRGVITITTHANTITANESCKGMFKDFSNMTDILFGLFFNTVNTTDMSEMFMGCTNVKSINLIDIVNTSNVTDMSYMFSGCENATRILLGNEFYTINVKDMTHMFNNCVKLKAIDLGQYFDTRNVTDMSYMFNECQALSFMDVGELFWTYNVKKYDYMFYNITVDHLHFNSRFYINPSLNPTGVNMVHNAGYYAWYVTNLTFSWIKNPANNTGYNPPSNSWNGGQGTTQLTQKYFPTD